MPVSLSPVEENYLKAIFKLSENGVKSATTNAIAAELQTTAASVTDMLKRLAEKALLDYEKYRGVTLTESGSHVATALIRKHRLWEVFLVEKLGFAWDKVHDVAEQLEHVEGEGLVDRLDAFLGYPKFDPHGDPIPDATGRWTLRQQVLLSTLKPGEKGVVTGVDDHSSAFLQYLDQMGLSLGASLELLERYPYDHSARIRTHDGREIVLSDKVGQNLYVKVI